MSGNLKDRYKKINHYLKKPAEFIFLKDPA
jgi:hypothetical protein